MTSGNAYPNQPEPDTSRERIELETRVLAAALRQSLERGDTVGSSHAHQQIFILLKASQEMGWEEPISLPPELMIEKDVRRPMPDIDWGAPDESPINATADEQASESALTNPIAASAPIEAIDIAEESESELSLEPVGEFAATSQIETEVASEEANLTASVTEPQLDSVAHAEAEVNQFAHLAHQPDLSELVAPALDVSAEVDSEATHEVISEVSSEEHADAVAAVQPATSAQPVAPSQPLVTVPAFALVSVPTFGSSAPATGAAAVLDFYLRLQVSDIADFASIHKSFLRKVRPLLRQHASGTLAGQAKRDLLLSLQSLWIAHDILCDPVTRTDYDFRRMGLRGGEEEVIEGKPNVVNRPQLRIGELLLCAGLLETTELEIAADMHKAMPELMFGAFLVKQGFIEEDDLNCVLLGQQLLKTGGITAAQFQESMSERASSGKDFGDVLVARRYLSHVQLQDAYRHQMDDTLPRIPVVVSTVSLEASAADVAEALSGDDSEDEGETSVDNSVEVSELSKPEEDEQSPSSARPRELLNSSPSLNIGNAVPSWKDQLDWDSPESGAETGTPSLASLYETGSSRSDTADLSGHASPGALAPGSIPSRFEQGKKKSLTDLMAELDPVRMRPEESVPSDIPTQSPFASIWADNSHSDSNSSGTVDDVAASDEEPAFAAAEILPPVPAEATPPDMVQANNEQLPVISQDDFAPPNLEHDEDLALVEEEFAALDAAADEALKIGDQAEPELNINAPMRPEQQKESGSWQIVSVPASALASLLLDDEPEGEDKPKPSTEPVKERRQLKTSFANDRPFGPKPNGDNNPPGGDRRNKKRKTKQ